MGASGSTSASASRPAAGGRRSSRSRSSRMRAGTVFTGVLVTTRTPKTPSRNSSITASAAPTPRSSGPAASEPTRPPALARASPVGESPPRWNSPVTASSSAAQPIPTRPRSSGCGSCRSRCTPATASRIGSTAAAVPIAARSRSSTVPPTGPPPCPQTPTPTMTARPSTARPSPSRRCAGSSRAVAACRPTARAAPPAPRASISQLAETARPADASGPPPRRRAAARVAPPRGRVELRAGTPPRVAARPPDPAHRGPGATRVSRSRPDRSACRDLRRRALAWSHRRPVGTGRRHGPVGGRTPPWPEPGGAPRARLEDRR